MARVRYHGCGVPVSPLSPKHSCAACGRHFGRKGDLTRHEKIHQGVKNHKCHICSKCFGQYSGLKTHLNTHNNEKPHQCRFCARSFADPSSCTRHEKERHRSTAPYQCPRCASRITRRSVFAEHLKKKHEIDTATFDIDSCAPPLRPAPVGNQRKDRKVPILTVDTLSEGVQQIRFEYDTDLTSASSSGSASPTDLLPSPVDGAELLPNIFQLPPYPDTCIANYFGTEGWVTDHNSPTVGQLGHTDPMPTALSHSGDVRIVSPDGNSTFELSGGYYHLTTREVAFSPPNYWPYDQGKMDFSEFSFFDSNSSRTLY